ncbi:hypothetical protein [Pseudomonas tolaasii]|uniref:hypothetical protein n=1 Tax=Pseudomonas tolaasii TaxID=29442 RepID=UPI001C5D86F4|nr:hypothetical protein [Pseudomonas tolaasii]MBW4793240.1 hypothetical protein [Pseudomonas tolaasii]
MNDLPVSDPGVKPLPFDPSFEQVPGDDTQTSEELAKALHSILEATFNDNGHATRSVYSKSHGLLRGRTVFDNLPAELNQGLLPDRWIYRWCRFSTNTSDILDDKVTHTLRIDHQHRRARWATTAGYRGDTGFRHAEC